MSAAVRDEEPGDIPLIRKVVTAAFDQALEADLVDRLRADGDSVISLVAIEDAELAGHVMLSKMSAPFPALGLAPVAVAPARQRSGIGSLLIRTALDRAREEDWAAVFVLGDPAYYRRFGFDPALAAGFESPYAGPYLMALALKGPLPATTGRIDYAPTFADLDGR